MSMYLCSAGTPSPLGASITTKGCNFAVYAKHAEQVLLCLFDDQDCLIEELPLTHKHHGVWHIEVAGVGIGQHYAFRANGAFQPESMHVFNPNKLLLDPYAKLIASTVVYHPDLACVSTTGDMNHIDSAPLIPKCIVTENLPALEPPRQTVKPHERCLYELHIKGFTQNLSIDESLKGRYLGVAQPAALSHLRSLGISTIQIMPCFSFMDESHLHDKGLTNYWGYNPVSFFAPDWRYAISDPISEFRQMVDALRNAGFEVILDVVYNHTAEGELHQATLNLKGLDNQTYYRHEAGQYLNYTGCGNCVDTFQDPTIQLVCDSLRYWYEVMGVDGFRFDLGADLGRTQHEFDTKAPLLSAIRQDPILSKALLISEPWDIGPGGYQLGQFPSPFLECNDRFRDTARRFWRGDEGIVPQFATCVMGSRDVFHKGNRPASDSVNYITYHDGYTLHDLVSYHRRHNITNGEHNRDGHGENISQNFGVEGEIDDARVRQARVNQQICFFATLFLSQGTPHMLAGDEQNNSQQGNNNAYCQDNDTSWLPWSESPERSQLTEACATLIALRKQYPCLAKLHLSDDPLVSLLPSHEVTWFNECGQPMSTDDWHDPERDFLAYTIKDTQQGVIFMVMYYREDQPMEAVIPDTLHDVECLFESSNTQISSNTVTLTQRSVIVLKAHL